MTRICSGMQGNVQRYVRDHVLGPLYPKQLGEGVGEQRASRILWVIVVTRAIRG